MAQLRPSTLRFVHGAVVDSLRWARGPVFLVHAPVMEEEHARNGGEVLDDFREKNALENADMISLHYCELRALIKELMRFELTSEAGPTVHVRRLEIGSPKNPMDIITALEGLEAEAHHSFPGMKLRDFALFPNVNTLYLTGKIYEYTEGQGMLDWEHFINSLKELLLPQLRRLTIITPDPELPELPGRRLTSVLLNDGVLHTGSEEAESI